MRQVVPTITEKNRGLGSEWLKNQNKIFMTSNDEKERKRALQMISRELFSVRDKKNKQHHLKRFHQPLGDRLTESRKARVR